jgi:hypothetical protein
MGDGHIRYEIFYVSRIYIVGNPKGKAAIYQADKNESGSQLPRNQINPHSVYQNFEIL